MTDYPSFDESAFNQNAAGQRIVYVRPVNIVDLPGEIQAKVEVDLGQQTVYAIHAPTGEVLALVPDRDRAFVVARQNAFAPVSVH